MGLQHSNFAVITN